MKLYEEKCLKFGKRAELYSRPIIKAVIAHMLPGFCGDCTISFDPEISAPVCRIENLQPTVVLKYGDGRSSALFQDEAMWVISYVFHRELTRAVWSAEILSHKTLPDYVTRLEEASLVWAYQIRLKIQSTKALRFLELIER